MKEIINDCLNWLHGYSPSAVKAKVEWENRCLEGVLIPSNHGHSKVQLWEDGPYWADTNIGAQSPWEGGCYFMWGDTSGYMRKGKVLVSISGARFSNYSYFFNAEEVKDGGVANGVLTLERDAAHVIWGGDWRMPTVADFMQLHVKCDWTWAKMNGVRGYVIRGRGNYASASIFLPCAGRGDEKRVDGFNFCGDYWSASSKDVDDAYALYFSKLSIDYTISTFRNHLRTIRPVQGLTK